MTTNRYPHGNFSTEDIQALTPTMKVGILGTVNPQGLPHLTMISTLMAGSATQVVWGQFMEGHSKEHVRANPKTGFLIMTLDKNIWRGKALFSHTTREGKDYDFYNNSPLFRYNAYFGVHTVYNMDLVAQSGRHPLPMNRIIFAAVQTMLARSMPRSKPPEQVFNLWTRAFLNKLDNLKFLGVVGADGFPLIIPLIQAQTLDAQHVVFSFGAFGDELSEILPSTPAALFGMALSMEDVLVRGEYLGVQRIAGVECGVMRVNWVYNAMPPKPMQIYPELELEPVSQF